MNSTFSRLFLALCLALSAVGLAWFAFSRNDVRFSDSEAAVIAGMSLSRLRPPSPDPSNRVADDPGAAVLGEELFSDLRLSRNQDVSCASCHLPERGFLDNALPGQGVGITTRTAMPLAGTAYSPWLFWDGRADSLWAQALGPIEHPGEHGFDRVGVARLVSTHYSQAYEAVFGPLPGFDDLPASATPLGNAAERAAWSALDPDKQWQIDTIFANVGKAIAAFERTLQAQRGRFDDFADALARNEASDALTPSEQQGLAIFIGKGQCIQCHNGPLFTNQTFHNTGVPLAAGLPLDLGRSAALALVDADPFNCLGRFSDADQALCIEMRFKLTDDSLVRAFKTPSLRAVGMHAPYMHAGQFSDLDAVIAHYNAAPWSVVGVSELHRLQLTDAERAALADFLKTL